MGAPSERSDHNDVEPGEDLPAGDVCPHLSDRKIVAEHRARLDWLLRVPEWTVLYAQGLGELELPGRRQGIAFNAALMSLPLECKYELIRWVIGSFRGHLHAEVGQRMCGLLGLERFNRLDLDEFLTTRQWLGLRDEALFRLSRVHRGYKQAQQRLFAAFRHLVDLVVAQAVFRPDLRADSAQEGALGLLAAIDRTNETDESFSAYANQWIRRFVRNHLMRQRLPVHAPINLVSRAAAARLGDSEPVAAVADPERVVGEFLRHAPLSLDEPIDARGVSVAETVPDVAVGSPDEVAGRAELNRLVARALELLTEKQREVIVRHYGLDGRAVAKLTEIARALGISHQQVSMRQRRALQRMQPALAAVGSELYGTG